MLIHITGSTFWLLVFLLSLFGFCFIRNHASSLVVNVFFYCFLKKKKVRKLQVNPFPSPVRADHRRSRCGCRYYEVGVLSFRSLFFYLHYYTPLHVHSSPCLLLPVMCLSRVVLVWGSTPAGTRHSATLSACLTALLSADWHISLSEHPSSHPQYPACCSGRRSS